MSNMPNESATTTVTPRIAGFTDLVLRAVQRAHQEAFGDLPEGSGLVEGVVQMRRNLNALTRRCTTFEAFLDLTACSLTYRPTLLARERAWRDPDVSVLATTAHTQLADAYDAFQETVGDERRAIRRCA